MVSLADLPTDVARSFDHLVDAVWDGRVDPGLLERCRRRVCELLDAPEDCGRHRSAPTPAPDSPAVHACLAFTELWTIDPHAVTDDVARTVRDHLDDPAAAAFTIGLATIEAQARAVIALAHTR